MLTSEQINALINKLSNELFKSEYNRLEKRKLDIVSENRKLQTKYFDGFMYRGNFYTDLDKSIASKGTKGNISLSLVPTMEAYIKDYNTVDFDKARVKQLLLISLKDCNTLQDLRDALPNQLADMVDQLKNISRQRPEAFNLLSNPTQYNQYIKLREKIEFYTALKLIY